MAPSTSLAFWAASSRRSTSSRRACALVPMGVTSATGGSSGVAGRAWVVLAAQPVPVSIEQVGLVGHDLVVERLEAQPAGGGRADLAAGQRRALVIDRDRVAGGFGHQLDVTRAFHGDEPPGRLVDRAADREQAVVAQDRGLAV